MERRAYSVDEKLFDLLVKENFDKLNANELQKLFGNLPYEISDKWVFTNEAIEGRSHFQFLYGYKYFSLIDYGNNTTYKIGIPEVSGADDEMDRQKCVVILLQHGESDNIIELKKQVFNRLADGAQVSNYLINNRRQILIKSFADFFDADFKNIQNQVEQNNSPIDPKNAFFITYYVDPTQFEEHKKGVAEKLHTLKDIRDINIKEIFFKPYTDKDIIELIKMEIRTMDLVRAINEYMRADASLYLQWGEPVRYNRFSSQMLSQYEEKKADEENIKNVEQLISDELLKFSGDWYDNESLVLSSKNSFYFRSRQRIDEISNSLRGFVSFIYNNILKLCLEKLRRCYNKIRLYIVRKTWVQIVIGYTLLSIFSGFCQAIFQKWIVR